MRRYGNLGGAIIRDSNRYSAESCAGICPGKRAVPVSTYTANQEYARLTR
jgi:hypothetical protein